MTLASLIKQLRTEAGFTQEQLAEKSGLSVGFIRDVEQSRRADITLGSAQKLAAALGVTCERFVGIETDTSKPTDAPKRKRG